MTSLLLGQCKTHNTRRLDPAQELTSGNEKSPPGMGPGEGVREIFFPHARMLSRQSVTRNRTKRKCHQSVLLHVHVVVHTRNVVHKEWRTQQQSSFVVLVISYLYTYMYLTNFFPSSSRALCASIDRSLWTTREAKLRAEPTKSIHSHQLCRSSRPRGTTVSDAPSPTIRRPSRSVWRSVHVRQPKTPIRHSFVCPDVRRYRRVFPTTWRTSSKEASCSRLLKKATRCCRPICAD